MTAVYAVYAVCTPLSSTSPPLYKIISLKVVTYRECTQRTQRTPKSGCPANLMALPQRQLPQNVVPRLINVHDYFNHLFIILSDFRVLLAHLAHPHS